MGYNILHFQNINNQVVLLIRNGHRHVTSVVSCNDNFPFGVSDKHSRRNHFLNVIKITTSN